MKCAYGCGEGARYQLKNGKWICSESPTKCVINRGKNSKGVYKAYKEGRKKYEGQFEGKREWAKGLILKGDEEIFCLNTLDGQYVKKAFLLKVEYKCAICGIDSWREEEIVLELDHVNGISRDNHFENLRFLCPNCHSQTFNFRGRNINKGKRKYSDAELSQVVLMSKNIREVCLAIGIAPKGANYDTIKRRMNFLSLSFSN